MSDIQHQGAVALTATIITLLAILVLSGGLYFALLRAVGSVRQAEFSEQSFLAAESGLEDIVLRHVDTGKQLPGGSSLLVVNGATATTTFSGAGDITITSDSNLVGNRRVATVLLIENTDSAQFSYALQIGNGGLFMENDSQVVGTVYSNGNAEGTGNAVITGDVWVAGTGFVDGIDVGVDAHAGILRNMTVTGSAFAANEVDNVSVGVDARSDIIRDSSITSDAYYDTSITGTTVGGSTFPGTPPPSEVDAISYPISNQQLDDWQMEAEAGGTWGGACPLELSGTDTLSLGPLVIPCDVTMENQAVLTLTGKVWVQGDFLLKNDSVLQLDPSFGSIDGVFIVYDPANPSGKGLIQIDNDAIVKGSGDPDSYLMLVSRNNSFSTGGSLTAILVKNGTASGVLFAPDGEMFIQNDASLFEATAWRLHLKNTAIVEYQSGLANLNFSSGPTGGWALESWQEVE